MDYVNCNLYNLNNILNIENIEDIFKHIYNYNCIYITKEVVRELLRNNYNLEHHNTINDNDRTSISLLYHENIIDSFKKLDEKTYINCLHNFCYADYIDRITFQKQIWTFNEMSSLIKIMNNNYLLKNQSRKIKDEIRFTKVLTKYSTEYNNKLFLIRLSQKINSDIDELFIKYICNNNYFNENISDLESNRIKKFFKYFMIY